MNTTNREIVSRLASLPRAAPVIAAMLLILAPAGVLVSQEAPQSTAPAQSQPTAKKAAEPATKPAPSAAKPASEAKPATASGAKPAAASEPAGESETESADGDQSQAPKRFIPSQKSSADNSATFPIDI
jgi:hypothetical protein